MSPIWTLAPISALVGALAIWILHRTTDRVALSATIGRIQAHLLEFWLFAGEPSLIWKSWKGLLSSNARLCRLLWKPTLLLSVPLAPLLILMDAQYGTAPLPLGKPAVVTVALTAETQAIPELTAPPGITVESPPVRVASDKEVSWRIRPHTELTGNLECHQSGGRKLEKSIAAGPDFHFHAGKRSRSPINLIRNPTELPLPEGEIAWIEVEYPPAAISLLSVQAPWQIWLVIFSLLGAAGAQHLGHKRIPPSTYKVAPVT